MIRIDFRLWVLFVCVVAASCTPGGRTAPRTSEPALVAEQIQRNVESFDKIWATVGQRHWDRELGGLDWDAVKEELRPRVEQATSMSEARRVMTEMLGRLDQSHFGVVPREVYGEIGAGSDPDEDPDSTGDGVTGATVRVIDSRALVVDVDPRLAAAAAGVRPGWEIVSVRGRKVAPVLEAIRAEYADSTQLEAILSGTVQQRMSAAPGREVEIEFLDGTGKTVTLEIACSTPPGKLARLGHLPAMYMEFESRLIGDDVGYIAFTVFIDPMTLMKSFSDAVTGFIDADVKGVIVDIRGNPGGIGGMAMGIGGWFVEERNLRLGTMITRESSLKFVLNPRPRTFGGPLAILVDGLSMSTSEILAGGLQELGRARVFGTPTAGAALPSLFERLPNGDGFQYAFANYVSVGGEPLEGRGVVPDTRVAPDRESLLAGRDNALDAAVEWIRAR